METRQMLRTVLRWWRGLQRGWRMAVAVVFGTPFLCMLCICMVLVVPTPRQLQADAPTTAAQQVALASAAEQSPPAASEQPAPAVGLEQPSATLVPATPSATIEPTIEPSPTALAPPTGQAVTTANLRSEPRVASETVIGKLCEGDKLEYLSIQQVGTDLWFQVRVVSEASACDPARASVGTIGWAAGSVISEASYNVREYARSAGIQLPTAIPSTAALVPPTPRPTQAPIPAGPRFRVGAVCRDGSHSSATGRGACSHHGGVAYWLYNR